MNKRTSEQKTKQVPPKNATLEQSIEELFDTYSKTLKAFKKNLTNASIHYRDLFKDYLNADEWEQIEQDHEITLHQDASIVINTSDKVLSGIDKSDGKELTPFDLVYCDIFTMIEIFKPENDYSKFKEKYAKWKKEHSELLHDIFILRTSLNRMALILLDGKNAYSTLSQADRDYCKKVEERYNKALEKQDIFSTKAIENYQAHFSMDEAQESIYFEGVSFDLEITYTPPVENHEEKHISYDIGKYAYQTKDPISRVFWNNIGIEENGQMFLALNEKKKNIVTNSKLHGITSLNATFDFDDSVTITKPIGNYDQRISDAIGSLMCSDLGIDLKTLRNNPNEINGIAVYSTLSIESIYKAMGSPNSPNSQTKKNIIEHIKALRKIDMVLDSSKAKENKLNKSSIRLTGALIHCDVIEELEGKTIINGKETETKWEDTIINGSVVNGYIIVYALPLLFRYAVSRGMFLSHDRALLEYSPMPKTEIGISIENYFLNQIDLLELKLKKAKKDASRNKTKLKSGSIYAELSLDTVYKACKSDKNKRRTKEKICAFLDYLQNQKKLDSYSFTGKYLRLYI